jgi:hypothetical protein
MRGTSVHASRPAVLIAGLLLLGVPGLGAQEIVFDEDLPRTLVFIQEEGRGKVASREMTSFLLEAGFPVIDPALAIDEASQELVFAATNGNDGAATQLGRDWGAQLLVLGVADYETVPDPVSQTLQTATTYVSVRALRLDVGAPLGGDRLLGPGPGLGPGDHRRGDGGDGVRQRGSRLGDHARRRPTGDRRRRDPGHRSGAARRRRAFRRPESRPSRRGRGG